MQLLLCSEFKQDAKPQHNILCLKLVKADMVVPVCIEMACVSFSFVVLTTNQPVIECRIGMHLASY